MTKVLLFGAGAVGSVYVYTLMQAGASVTAVCRSNYEAVKRDGFIIYSIKFGNVQCRPGVVRTVAEAAPLSSELPFDFIVVCSKSFPGSSPSLSEMIKPAVGPSTAIVLMQNGINIESDVAANFPQNPILSCAVYIPSTEIRPGVIDYGASYNETLNLLEIGTYPSTTSSTPESHKHAADLLAALVQKGGGNATVFADIQPRRWVKVVMNASWSPISALSLCADADFLRSSPGAVDLVRGVMLEVVSVAKALQVPGMDEAVVEKQLSIAKARVVGREPSMLADVRNGRPLEIEAIVGNVVRLARDHHVQVPLLEAVYALTKGLYEAGVRSRLAATAAAPAATAANGTAS